MRSFVQRGEPQLDQATLDRAVAVLGQPASVNALFSKLTAGEPISLGVFGASMAQNGGCLNQFGKRCMQFSGLLGYRKGFAVRLLEHINRTWPHRQHSLFNAARDAAPITSAFDCMYSHMAADVDLVVLEWGSMATHNHKFLPYIEKVARLLLARPQPPVLLHVGVTEWCTQRLGPPRRPYRVGDQLHGSVSGFTFPDTPWARVEREMIRVSSWYDQAALSIPAALGPPVQAGAEGFAIKDVTGDDCLHFVNGVHGLHYVTQILTHWFDLAHRVWNRTRLARQLRLRPNPRNVRTPLWPQNAANETVSRCYVAAADRRVSKKSKSIKWCNAGNTQLPGGGDLLNSSACWASSDPVTQIPGDGKAAARAKPPAQCDPIILETRKTAVTRPQDIAREIKSHDAYAALVESPPAGWFYCHVSLAQRRKISDGIVALRMGAVARFEVDTFLGPVDSVIRLEHLVSYERMGVVQLSCAHGCTCETHSIDAHRNGEVRDQSIYENHEFAVTSAATRQQPCELQLEVLKETSSGGHKFKVRQIVVRARG